MLVSSNLFCCFLAYVQPVSGIVAAFIATLVVLSLAFAVEDQDALCRRTAMLKGLEALKRILRDGAVHGLIIEKCVPLIGARVALASC